MSKTVITADFLPVISKTELNVNSRYRFTLKELESMGSGFAVAATEIGRAVLASESKEGLYRCVFPNGVTGTLASFNDGSGYLGTIMNEKGFAGQARWIPVEGQSIAMTMNPVTIAIAVAIMGVNKKLDRIQKTQEKILQYLKQDKESRIEGDINTLNDIFDQYRFNSDNSQWQSGKLSVVTEIKRTAEGNIVFFKKQISNVFGKQKPIHSNHGAYKLMEEVEQNLLNYQICVYIIAFSSFLEILLGDNYSENYLQHITDKIRDCSIQYKMDYTKCYEQLEGYMNTTLQSVALGGIGSASKNAGKALSKVPVLGKGPVDEVLVSMGKGIDKLHSRHGKEALERFRQNSDAGIQAFIENISTMKTLCNESVELLFDSKNVYIA